MSITRLPDGNIRISFSVRNQSNSEYTSVVGTLTHDGNILVYAADNPSQGSYVDGGEGTGTWTVGTLDAGSTETLTVDFTPDVTGSFPTEVVLTLTAAESETTTVDNVKTVVVTKNDVSPSLSPADSYAFLSLPVYAADVDVDTGADIAGVAINKELAGYELVGVTAAIDTLGASSGAETIYVDLRRKRGGAPSSTVAELELAKDVYFLSADFSADELEYLDFQEGDVITASVTNALDTTDATGLHITLTFRKI